MQIGIDYTSAARQRAGIGRYTRELVTALLTLGSPHQYVVFAATGGLSRDRWRSEIERLRTVSSVSLSATPAAASRLNSSLPSLATGSQLKIRDVPLSDDWLARLWHRLCLPIPAEIITGALDVFYSPDFALPPTRRACQTLLTVHDLSFVHHPDAFVPTLRRYLERVVPRSIERADLVLADSAHTRSDLVRLFAVPHDRVQVIYPGVDMRFQPEPEPGESARLQERYAIGDRPYVLSVGTLQPRKNYVRLIQAFVRSRASKEMDIQLLIAGGRGWLYGDVLAEAEKHDSVRLLGFVEDRDLPALYREAALFAFPSLYEGFGLPVLEAMGCGVPVVCSRTSSLPEVAGDAALFVDPLDVDGLEAALTRALEDENLRRRMVERGLVRAARYDWVRSAAQLLDVIEALEEDEPL
ncbi:MAG: glycosyltransferase family 1 protein [Anaerolineae bacterium]|jgi:glycosyltransferase involved in cell wall biosynthesis